jgi:hypothetical protein
MILLPHKPATTMDEQEPWRKSLIESDVDGFA